MVASSNPGAEGVERRAAQVAAQCRVVAHLATALANVHADYALLAQSPVFADILDQVGRRSASLMEQLGDILNDMDAVSGDDAWTEPVFEEAQRLFPATTTIPAASAEGVGEETGASGDLDAAVRAFEAAADDPNVYYHDEDELLRASVAAALAAGAPHPAPVPLPTGDETGLREALGPLDQWVDRIVVNTRTQSADDIALSYLDAKVTYGDLRHINDVLRPQGDGALSLPTGDYDPNAVHEAFQRGLPRVVKRLGEVSTMMQGDGALPRTGVGEEDGRVPDGTVLVGQAPSPWPVSASGDHPSRGQPALDLATAVALREDDAFVLKLMDLAFERWHATYTGGATSALLWALGQIAFESAGDAETAETEGLGAQHADATAEPQGAAGTPSLSPRTAGADPGAGDHGGIYVASKTRYAAMWRGFREAGHPIISTWIDEAGAGETSDWSDLWRRCIAEAAGCGALVCYAEPGDVLKGALVEVGAALAAGRRVIVAGAAEIATFRHHALVSIEPDLTRALDQARALTPASPAAAADPGVGDEDHERLQGIKRRWADHLPLTEPDYSWLICLASDALAPSAAVADPGVGDAVAVTQAAGAIVDVWMGGDRSWRTRDGDGPSQEFMAGADWEMAIILAKAVLSILAPAPSAAGARGAECRPIAEAPRNSTPILIRFRIGSGLDKMHPALVVRYDVRNPLDDCWIAPGIDGAFHISLISTWSRLATSSPDAPDPKGARP